MGESGGFARKFRRFCAELAALGAEHRIKVEPRRKRDSGPRELPSDWWERDKQAQVLAQCLICHTRMLPGSPPLARGICGPCTQRLDETPDAA